MMSLDFSNASMGGVISTLTDLGFFVGILVVGWRSRALIQPAIDFFKTANSTMGIANRHMLFMETSMNTLINNHATHIEEDIAKLVGRHIVNHERVSQAVIRVAQEDTPLPVVVEGVQVEEV